MIHEQSSFKVFGIWSDDKVGAREQTRMVPSRG